MQWFAAKKQVDEKPANFQSTINEYEKNSPGSIKKSDSGKLQRICVTLQNVFDYPCELVIYQGQKDGVKSAFYVLYDKIKGRVYKRDIY